MSSRLKIDQISCEVDGLVTLARVQLSLAGTSRVGVASTRTDDSAWQQVVAEATINAVRAFVGAHLDVHLDSVMVVTPGRYPLVVVTMTSGNGRGEVFLSGTAPIIEDRNAAAAKAVLHGLNRHLEPLLLEERPAPARLEGSTTLLMTGLPQVSR